MKEIVLIIKPNPNGIKLNWYKIPRTSELITYLGTTYRVVTVVHEVDKDEIQVAVVDFAKELAEMKAQRV